MNGFTEPRASGAEERPGAGDVVMTFPASQAMLPLVGRISADIMRMHQRLAALHPEQTRLDRQRRTLDWGGRSRRYSIQEEIVGLERELTEALAELTALNVVLLDGVTGLVGFPTMVNDRRAYFSWRPGEDGLKSWNFADDVQRHPIPEHWTQSTREPTRGRAKKR
jgi:hypothetical protein